MAVYLFSTVLFPNFVCHHRTYAVKTCYFMLFLFFVFPFNLQPWICCQQIKLKKSLNRWYTASSAKVWKLFVVEKRLGFRRWGFKFFLPIQDFVEGTSLAMHWLRLCLPMQGEWIWSTRIPKASQLKKPKHEIEAIL